MTAAFVEPIVHNSPDRWDALALICVGLAIAGILALLIWGSSRANDFWTAREAAAEEAAAHTATKTKTWADRWGGHAKDIADLEASVARGEQRVILTTVRRKNPTRLADFAAEQKRRSA